MSFASNLDNAFLRMKEIDIWLFVVLYLGAQYVLLQFLVHVYFFVMATVGCRQKLENSYLDMFNFPMLIIILCILK